ncbi:MAG: DoxX family protein [Clostridia bacterium]|nr:DoxX family protein [Clostridia bacterium]
MSPAKLVAVSEPPIARWLFASVQAAPIWLVLRLYLGYEWLMAGLGKIGSPAWTGAQAGAAVRGFAQGALQKTGGEHPDVAGWYAAFLREFVIPNAPAFGWTVALGETAVGIALVLGLFTGIAAFFGCFMNLNYLFAGTVSANPLWLLIAIFLMLAWRNAGWWGLDRFALRWIGTPWQPGEMFHRR